MEFSRWNKIPLISVSRNFAETEFYITEFRGNKILRNRILWEWNSVDFFQRNKIPRVSVKNSAEFCVPWNSVFLRIPFNRILRKRNSVSRNSAEMEFHITEFRGNGIPRYRILWNFTEFCDKLQWNSGEKFRRNSAEFCWTPYLRPFLCVPGFANQGCRDLQFMCHDPHGL